VIHVVTRIPEWFVGRNAMLAIGLLSTAAMIVGWTLRDARREWPRRRGLAASMYVGAGLIVLVTAWLLTTAIAAPEPERKFHDPAALRRALEEAARMSATQPTPPEPSPS
jgi:hypothetical protein